MRVIAIDGPAGAGKSTVARALAARLGLQYLDTGAMYRAVTLAAMRRGIDPTDVDRVAELAEAVDLEVGERGVFVDGVEATTDIRSREVTTAVSAVAAKRRGAESGGDVDEIEASIAQRDRHDQSRTDGPLVEAAGAIVVDTTGLSIDQVLEQIEQLLERQ